MSLATARTEILAALRAVEGITAEHHRPRTVGRGTAWVRWAGSSRGPGAGPTSEWQVFVAVGGDELAALAWVDEHAAELMHALAPAGYVTAVTPVQVPTDSGTVNAVSVTLVRE
jgi:hypothetical protein